MNPNETDWILISETQKPDACPAAPKSSAPLPVPHSRLAHRQYPGPDLTLGGLPIPVPKVRAKSATVPLPVRIQLSGDALVSGPTDALPSRSLPSRSTGLSFPLLPVGSSKRQQTKTSGQLLRLQHPSQSDWLVQQWFAILKDLGKFSTVAMALQDSSHAPQHAARLLDQFAPSTLLRYFQAWTSFAKTLKSLDLSLSTLTEAQLADALVTTSLAKSSDCSPGCQLTIKAIRWMSTHAGVEQLKIAWRPLIESFLKSRIPKELKESIPISLYTIVQFERRILMAACTPAETIILGSILACVWGGLRFADAQRCSFKSFCFDGESFRATCWRTKTSSRGQPWGFVAHGLLSLGTYSWTEKWLSTMDELWHHAKTTDLDMPVPDFLFPVMRQDGVELPWSAMQYAEALKWIRHMARLPWKSTPQTADHLSVHSMKSTLLSWGSQLMAEGQVSSEERLLQGHHRQSASRSLRLYSRDDVHGQLAYHKKLIDSIRRGKRFVTPQHRGGQLPVVEPAVQIEFFRKTSMSRQWLCFDFNKPVEVPESPQLPAAHDEQSSSESSDTSSSSDSSDSEVSKEVSARAAKRPKMVIPTDEPDEVMVASVSYVQHAMIGTTKDWFPYFQGRHYQAACGARLDPDRARFAQSADPSLHLCQRPACVKAWKAMLV